MGIDFNPYGVGAHQHASSAAGTTCSCCGVRFEYEVRTTGQHPPLHCPACISHYSLGGEPVSRELERLREHEPRLRKRVKLAEELLDAAYRDRDERRQQTAAALKSRDRWRAWSNAMLEVHAEDARGGCICGADRYPCVTMEAYETARAETDD